MYVLVCLLARSRGQQDDELKSAESKERPPGPKLGLEPRKGHGAPRGSKYPIFEVPGSKNQTLHGSLRL